MRSSIHPLVEPLSLTVLGCPVTVQCDDPEARALLGAQYGALQGPPGAAPLRYVVGRHPITSAFVIRREGQEVLMAADGGALLWTFEKALTIALQHLRRDLYFVHVAVLAYAGRAVLFAGASGCGKSTTAWALLHHGFSYGSDELAPVDLHARQVVPYPRALGLKGAPPGPYRLPTGTLATSRGIHIPTVALPGVVGRGPTRLAALLFVHYRPEHSGPTVRPLSQAEPAARLFAQALNPLAHPADGLDAAIAIAARTPGYELRAWRPSRQPVSS